MRLGKKRKLMKEEIMRERQKIQDKDKKTIEKKNEKKNIMT